MALRELAAFLGGAAQGVGSGLMQREDQKRAERERQDRLAQQEADRLFREAQMELQRQQFAESQRTNEATRTRLAAEEAREAEKFGRDTAREQATQYTSTDVLPDDLVGNMEKYGLRVVRGVNGLPAQTGLPGVGGVTTPSLIGPDGMGARRGFKTAEEIAKGETERLAAQFEAQGLTPLATALRASGGRLGGISPDLTKTPEQLAANREAEQADRLEQIRLQNQGNVDVVRAREAAQTTPAGLTTRDRVDYQQALTRLGGRPEVKDFREMGRHVSAIDEAMKTSAEGGNMIAVDQALINAFNKLMDPTSVVRESEYARTGSDMAVLNRLRGQLGPDGKLAMGGAGLTRTDREAIARMARSFAAAAQQKSQAATEEVASSYDLIPTATGQTIGEMLRQGLKTGQTSAQQTTGGTVTLVAPTGEEITVSEAEAQRILAADPKVKRKGGQ